MRPIIAIILCLFCSVASADTAPKQRMGPDSDSRAPVLVPIVPAVIIKPVTKVDPVRCIVWCASWCGPCQAMHPTLEKLKKEGFDIEVYDVDHWPGKKQEWAVRCMPTLIWYRSTGILWRCEGGQSEAAIRAKFKELQR